jgi:hypothetical protein
MYQRWKRLKQGFKKLAGTLFCGYHKPFQQGPQRPRENFGSAEVKSSAAYSPLVQHPSGSFCLIGSGIWVPV